MRGFKRKEERDREWDRARERFPHNDALRSSEDEQHDFEL